MTQGQRVRVRNFTLSGKEFVEGVATLEHLVRKHPDGVERWMVRFDGDEPGETYSRMVLDEDLVRPAPKHPTKRINLLDPR
ncbi:MAG: hypothetical protein ACYSW8_18710 [Planctomycetota bacterium]|jgi:hypothetical protein